MNSVVDILWNYAHITNTYYCHWRCVDRLKCIKWSLVNTYNYISIDVCFSITPSVYAGLDMSRKNVWEFIWNEVGHSMANGLKVWCVWPQNPTTSTYMQVSCTVMSSHVCLWVCWCIYRAAGELQNEAKSHVLNHKNIVGLFAITFERGHYGIVLEFVPDGCLEDFINRHQVLNYVLNYICPYV